MKQDDIDELPKLESSRLENLFNVYQTDSGEYFYNILNTVNFDANNLAPYTYTSYTTLAGDSYPFISYKKYKTINLWWLICAVNDIKNPTKLPAPGTHLKILNSDLITNILTTIGNA